jgi:hypothetical protein
MERIKNCGISIIQEKASDALTRAHALGVMRKELPLTLELEIWSLPGRDFIQHVGKEIALTCQQQLELPDGIVLGLSDVPDKVDAQNLAMSFRERELKKDDFYDFCETMNISKDINAAESAMWFLAHNYGRPVAWVHLPASSQGIDIGTRVLLWLSGQGYCLVMPQELYCISSETIIHDLLHDYA